MSPRHTTELVRVRRMLVSGEAQSIREAAGLSLAEMAAAVVDPANGIAGVSPATVHRWEHLERTPGGVLALAYGRALNRLRREIAA